MAYDGWVQAVWEAVVEPRRREILRLLRDREASAGAIAEHFPDVSRPAVSQHLRVLCDAGLLHERRDGTRRFYRARPDGLAEARAFFEEFRFSRLAALKVEAERRHRPRDRRPERGGR